MESSSHHPRGITINREKGEMRIVWQDGHQSVYPFPWLREHCPCAECEEARRRDEGRLPADASQPIPRLPSRYKVVDARLVGNYAIQIAWADGHDSGIYAFDWLRATEPPAG